MFALFLQVQFSYIFIRSMYGKLNSPNSINKFYFENQLTTIDIVFTFAGLLFFEVIFVLSWIHCRLISQFKRWKIFVDLPICAQAFPMPTSWFPAMVKGLMLKINKFFSLNSTTQWWVQSKVLQKQTDTFEIQTWRTAYSVLGWQFWNVVFDFNIEGASLLASKWKWCCTFCIACLCIRKFPINILLNDATNATFSLAPWQIVVHWMLAHYVCISFVLDFSGFNDINKWSALKIHLISNVGNHTMKLNWIIIRFSICFIY